MTAVFALFLGALAISFAPIFVNLISLGPTLIGLYRCAIGGIILFVIIFIKKDNSRQIHKYLFNKKFILLGLLAGFLFALDLYCWHKSVKYVGSGMGTILGNTQIFYLILLGSLIYRERPGKIFTIAAIMAFFGIYLLIGLQKYTILWVK